MNYDDVNVISKILLWCVLAQVSLPGAAMRHQRRFSIEAISERVIVLFTSTRLRIASTAKKLQ